MLLDDVSNQHDKLKLTLESLASHPYKTIQASQLMESFLHLGSWSSLAPLWSLHQDSSSSSSWSSVHFALHSSFQSPPQTRIWHNFISKIYFRRYSIWLYLYSVHNVKNLLGLVYMHPWPYILLWFYFCCCVFSEAPYYIHNTLYSGLNGWRELSLRVLSGCEICKVPRPFAYSDIFMGSLKKCYQAM